MKLNIKHYLFTGLLSILPLTATYWIVLKLFNFFSNPGYKLVEFIFSEKIPKYIEIFASLLCGIANKTKGKHSECEKINASSAAYKQTQDYLARFVSEKVKKAEASIKISKQNIKQEFKQWWSTEYSTSIPSKWGQELVEYLDKKLGKYERRGWHGWEIIYDTYDDEEADEEIQGV